METGMKGGGVWLGCSVKLHPSKKQRKMASMGKNHVHFPKIGCKIQFETFFNKWPPLNVHKMLISIIYIVFYIKSINLHSFIPPAMPLLLFCGESKTYTLYL